MSRSSFLLVVVSTTHKRLVPLSNIRVIFPGLLATCIPSGSREQKGKTENALAFFITDIDTPLEVAAVDDDSSRWRRHWKLHISLIPDFPGSLTMFKRSHQFQGRETPERFRRIRRESYGLRQDRRYKLNWSTPGQTHPGFLY